MDQSKGDPERRSQPRGDDRRGSASAWQRLKRYLGPGLITGAADDDPAGVGTYSQAGAQFQYGLLWTAVFQIPLMAAIQLMCARIGRASGRDLAGVLAEHYPRWVLWVAAVMLVVGNGITIVADLQAAAAALGILTHVPPEWFVLPLAVLIVAVVTLASYDRLRGVLRWTTLALFAYVAAGVLAGPDWGHVLRATFIPEIQWSSGYLLMFVAVFGTTISPYLFFWQAAEEVEEEKASGRKTVSSRRGTSPRVLRLIRADTIFGMALSQLIGYFVIISTGAVLFRSGMHNIDSAQQAALALRPLGGGLGTWLFCIGLIGTGLLAIPTLAGGISYALAPLFAWRTGIGEKPRRAPRFYISLAAVVGVSALLTFILQLRDASVVGLLVASAVINGVLAPPLMVMILLVTNNDEIMAGHTNGRALNFFGILATAIMAITALLLLAQLGLGLFHH